MLLFFITLSHCKCTEMLKKNLFEVGIVFWEVSLRVQLLTGRERNECKLSTLQVLLQILSLSKHLLFLPFLYSLPLSEIREITPEQVL